MNETKKKLMLALMLLLVLVANAAPTIHLAEATKPIAVEGTYSLNGKATADPLRYAGESGNTLQDMAVPLRWVGSIAGTGMLEVQWINLNDGTIEEVGIMHGIVTLTANIAISGEAKAGTLAIRLYNVAMLGGERTGRWTIIGGTDDLAGLHGEGTLEFISFMPPNVVVAYTGFIHFDPN